MGEEATLLPGTLDLLILKAVSLAPEHGYGVLLRIEQITGGALLVEQARSTPRSRGSSTRVCSKPSGALPTTIVARSSIGSPRPAVAGSRPTASDGAAWRWPCPERCARKRCDRVVGQVAIARRQPYSGGVRSRRNSPKRSGSTSRRARAISWRAG